MTPDEEREVRELRVELVRLRNRIRKLEHRHQEDIAEMATLRRTVDFLLDTKPETKGDET